MDKVEQSIKNGEGNQQALGNIYNAPVKYITDSHEKKEEIEIIQTIIENALGLANNFHSEETVQQNKESDLIIIKEKIKINFSKLAEQEELERYLSNTYQKVTRMQRVIQSLATDDQSDLENYIFYRYCYWRKQLQDPTGILHHLFEEFSPTHNNGQLKYLQMAQAFVLFYFWDCTIFERTTQEELEELNLFSPKQ